MPYCINCVDENGEVWYFVLPVEITLIVLRINLPNAIEPVFVESTTKTLENTILNYPPAL